MLAFPPSGPGSPGKPGTPLFPLEPTRPRFPTFPGLPLGPGGPGYPANPRGPCGPWYETVEQHVNHPITKHGQALELVGSIVLISLPSLRTDRDFLGFRANQGDPEIKHMIDV